MNIRETMIAATAGIALLAGPLHAGGPVLAEEAYEAEPRLVEVPEIPDAFHAIPLTTVPWGEKTPEGDAARELCGGPITFVAWKRDDANRLIHIAECR